MARAGRTRLPAAERRRLIEEAATELFAEHGYAATTVDDIVAAAGVTKPMLYRHFESKRDLYVQLLRRYRDAQVRAPLDVFKPGFTDRRVQLRVMIDAWLQHAKAHPNATQLLFTPVKNDQEIDDVQRELYAIQRATQAALLREFAPTVPEAEVEPLAEISRSALAAVALWWIEHPDVPPDGPAGALLRLCVGVAATVEAEDST